MSEFALRVAKDFEGGAWLVELASLSAGDQEAALVVAREVEASILAKEPLETYLQAELDGLRAYIPGLTSAI